MDTKTRLNRDRQARVTHCAFENPGLSPNGQCLIVFYATGENAGNAQTSGELVGVFVVLRTREPAQ